MLKPIKWLPSSCQTRKRTANVSLVKCIDLLVLNGWSFYRLFLFLRVFQLLNFQLW